MAKEAHTVPSLHRNPKIKSNTTALFFSYYIIIVPDHVIWNVIIKWVPPVSVVFTFAVDREANAIVVVSFAEEIQPEVILPCWFAWVVEYEEPAILGSTGNTRFINSQISTRDYVLATVDLESVEEWSDLIECVFGHSFSIAVF